MSSDTLDAFLAELALHAYGWPESLRFTYDTTRRLLADDVPGAFVECGVGNGVHPAAMARAILDHGPSSPARVVHLFDSFQGVPHGGDHDTEWNEHWGDGSGRLEPSGVAACSLTEVRNNLTRWDLRYQRFLFHQGWFQETVPRDADRVGAIAFLRLDGDLYESTKVCLEHLYPLVSPGGVVVVDDWNLDGCRAAVVQYLRETYGADYWSVWSKVHERDDEPWLLGAAAAAGDIAPQIHPITASGDVWWTKIPGCDHNWLNMSALGDTDRRYLCSQCAAVKTAPFTEV